jgi:sulfur carrier protein
MLNGPNDERFEPSERSERPARPPRPRTVQSSKTTPVRITLNGDPYELEQPVSVQELLERLSIDPRRVAVEHNMVIVRRHAFAATLVGDGDQVEIVNFVGGGSDSSRLRRDDQR